MTTWMKILIFIVFIFPIVIYFIRKNNVKIKLPKWKRKNTSRTLAPNGTPATPITSSPTKKKIGFLGWVWRIAVILGMIFLVVIIIGKISSLIHEWIKDKPAPRTERIINPITWPISGNETVSEDNPGKAGLMPGRSTVEVLDEDRAVIVISKSNPTVSIICYHDYKKKLNSSEIEIMLNKWRDNDQMKWGDYEVHPYPRGSGPVRAKWGDYKYVP